MLLMSLMPLMLLTHQPISTDGIGTANWFELAWILIGFVGLYNMLLLFLAGLGDYDVIIRENLNGSRKIVAKTSVITLGAKLLVLIGYALIGVVASLSQPLNADRQLTPTGLFITLTFLVTALALNVSGIVQRRARNQILEYEATRDREAERRRFERVAYDAEVDTRADARAEVRAEARAAVRREAREADTAGTATTIKETDDDLYR